MNTYYRLIQVYYYRFATNLHKLTTAHDDGENQNCRQASISITRAKSMKMGFKETESKTEYWLLFVLLFAYLVVKFLKSYDVCASKFGHAAIVWSKGG